VVSVQRPLRVLIVDDSPADVMLLRHAFAAAAVPVELFTAGNGSEALSMLNEPDAARPDVMLLDINMPGISGHDVLLQTKTSEHLRSIVVLMFTSSSSPRDVERAYENQANAYVIKPGELDRYLEVGRSVAEFWGLRTSLPRSGF
jgi:CheY-like chemotaxis protein